MLFQYLQFAQRAVGGDDVYAVIPTAETLAAGRCEGLDVVLQTVQKAVGLRLVFINLQFEAGTAIAQRIEEVAPLFA